MHDTPLPLVLLARHGETDWSLSGRHTGLADLPLTERGERLAKRLGERLASIASLQRQPVAVFASPLQRARRTCEMAGYGRLAVVDPDLVEWNYGEYEGLRSDEIRRTRPDWQLFRDGCPGGESPDQVAARADRVVGRLRACGGAAILFSSGHFLRVLAGRWLGLSPWEGAKHLLLDTASLSALGYEHDLSSPAITLWNEVDRG
jgi:probable phosphoglycerate mutase